MFSALNQVQVGVKDPYRTSQYPVEGRIGIKNEKTEQVSPASPSDKTGLFPSGHFQVRSHSFSLFTKPAIDKV